MKEISYETNTEYIKERIVEKYGSIQAFAPHTPYSQESIYKWVREGKMRTDASYVLADLLGITDLNKLRKGWR
ncbi:MAG: hypothetical protein RSE41_08525 [Clostridia bacterium]